MEEEEEEEGQEEQEEQEQEQEQAGAGCKEINEDQEAMIQEEYQRAPARRGRTSAAERAL